MLGGGREDRMGTDIVSLLAKARKVEKLLPEVFISEIGCVGLRFEHR